MSTRFEWFSNEELDAMEEAFCNEGLKPLVSEIRRERRYRAESEDTECWNKTRLKCHMRK